MDYAPVANKYLEPKTSIIEAQVKGLQQNGIVSCAKHLPSHDNTADDSQYGLPVVVKNKNELEAYELVPFRQAMKAGADAIMVADISPTRLDNTFDVVIDDLLANLISDCLEMGGIRATYGTEKEAVMGLKTGPDYVMVCHTLRVRVGAIEAIIAAVKSGEISQLAIESLVHQVLRLNAKYSSPGISNAAGRYIGLQMLNKA
ncbi:hypothetical protein BCON_0014g00160 [Botryotinia convoluta]|uniref:Glycoside hydrolase family 3 N-terminal domain-containing protein n=1 Tax=Botryotinia convoluta TaxID=54673 RepID=A0A4Z1J2Z5_9HELO|nr:hypothetical protein BCON_0014g00160 [Botryotinia convoluta]